MLDRTESLLYNDFERGIFRPCFLLSRFAGKTRASGANLPKLFCVVYFFSRTHIAGRTPPSVKWMLMPGS